MRGTYLYAILAGEHRLNLGPLGLPDGWTPVTTIAEAGLTALVSDYQGSSFDELPRATLLRGLSIHQRVIEHLTVEHPVLPVKFGTVLASHAEARSVLSRWYTRLGVALTYVREAVEIEVAATWDVKRTFAEIGRAPEVAALVATAVGQPVEDALALRVQVGKLVKEVLDRRREEYRRRVLIDLVALARDAQPNALLSDDLVLNVAFLVERASLGDFYARVHSLDECFAGLLTFRCVGPLPPYSFATVEITRARSDQIEAARLLLELGERVTEANLDASYWRLAARCHPDHHPEDPEAAKRFAALAAARAQLAAYLRTLRAEGAEPPTSGVHDWDRERQYDLSPTGVEGRLGLAIRRSGAEPYPDLERNREHDAVRV